MAAQYIPVTHVIFDFDGLLVSTEAVYTKATQAVCDPFGKQYTWEIKSQIMGMTPQLASQRIIELMDLPVSLDKFMEDVEVEIHKRLHEIELMPGALRLMDHLRRNQIPMAIATGSSSHTFAHKISKIPEVFELGRYFEHMVFAGDDPDVKVGKPNPDVYEVCYRRFKSPPKAPVNVLVFEDAPAGVISGQAAGMQVVMVPDPHLKHSEKPTVLLSSLEQFDPTLFSLPQFEVAA